MKKAFETARNPIADAPVDPPPEQPGDAALRDAVLRRIEADGRFANEPVSVLVTDGCAVLRGTVSLEYLRVLADACASAVPGVLVVRNQLDVSQTPPMSYTPPPEPTDER